MMRSVLFVFAAVVALFFAQVAFGEDEIACRGHFSGEIFMGSGESFAGSMPVSCRNFGTERVYIYNSHSRSWVLDWEGARWFEQTAMADPEYDLTLNILRDPFPENPEDGDVHQLQEVGFYSETVLLSQGGWMAVESRVKSVNQTCMEDVKWYVEEDPDMDGNGIRDDSEQWLAEKFCPALFLHSGDRGVSPEPVEIVGAVYRWKSCLYGRVWNVIPEVVGEWPASRLFWCGNGWPVRKDQYWDIEGPEAYRWINESEDYSLVCSSDHYIEWHFDWAGPEVNDPEGWYAAYGPEALENRYKDTVYAHLFRTDDRYVIQYWYFYPFNDFINDHEGDWEHINVILNVPGDNPAGASIEKLVYYFHHTCRVVENWFEIVDETHPVVCSGGYGYMDLPTVSAGEGHGSHGSFPFAGWWPGTGGEIPVVNESYDEYVDGEGRSILPPEFEVVVIKDIDEYTFPDEGAWAWLRANVAWGHIQVASMGGWYSALENVGNMAPCGPAFNPAWNVACGGEGYSSYDQKWILLSVRTNFSEGQVVIDGHVYQTPRNLVTAVGEQLLVNVESFQETAGGMRMFHHWDDGGAQQHTICPYSDRRYTAVFGKKGDINTDEELNIVDGILVANFILGVDRADAFQRWSGDWNGDGGINVLDLVGLVNIIMGTGIADPGDAGCEPAYVTLVAGEGGLSRIVVENASLVQGLELHMAECALIDSAVPTSRSLGLQVAFSSPESDSLIVVQYGRASDVIQTGNGPVLELFFSPGAEPRLDMVTLSSPAGIHIPSVVNHPPLAPEMLTPADRATSVPLQTELSWRGGDPDDGDAVIFDLFFEAEDETPDVVMFHGSDMTWYPGSLSPGTSYWWVIRATDKHGITAESAVGSFRTCSVPSVGNIIPGVGCIGSQVVINGAGFGPSCGSVVFPGGGSASVSTWTDSRIICFVPAGAVDGPVTITASCGTTCQSQFDVILAPVVTGLSPNSGCPGNALTMTGGNFGHVAGTVTFHYNKVAAVVSWTENQIRCTVPSGAVSGNVTVTTACGTSNGVSFMSSSPVVTALAPGYGAAGETITIRGSNFGSTQGNGSVVFYNNKVAAISSWNHSLITCTVPSGACDGAVKVITSCAGSNGVYFNVSGCGGSSGCPYVYVWNGKNWREDNNILPESEDTSRSELDVFDCFLIREKVTEQEGKVILQIREFEHERTYLDSVALLCVDHSRELQLGVTSEAELVLYRKETTALSCADSAGSDLLSLLSEEDDLFFEGFAGDWLVLDFGKVNAANHVYFKAVSDIKQAPVASILVQVLTDGSWQDAGSIHPRALWATDLVDLSEYLKRGRDGVTVRLFWTAHHKIDYAGLVREVPARMHVGICPLAVAVHSRLGTVTGQLKMADRSYGELIPQDTLQLEFSVSALRGGMKRAYVLASAGHYVMGEGDGPGSPKAASGIPPDSPGRISLLQNVPNPFNSTTTIFCTLPVESRTLETETKVASDMTPFPLHITLKIYNILGQEICTLMDDIMEGRTFSVVWHGQDGHGHDLPSGIYFYRLSGDREELAETGRMVLLR